MNINVIVVALLTTILGLYAWRAFSRGIENVPTELPWVPIDANKPRSFVNQTRDAGMFTERARRTAIISNPNAIFGHKGSTNGSLEYFLTSICVCPPRQVCPAEPEPVIWSNGDADDVLCDVVDAGGAFGGYEAVDSGGAFGNVCDE
jgi:hypothetical protein